MIFGAAGAIEEDPDHVFYMDEAEDVVERAFVHGDARALRGGEHGHSVFESGGGGEGVDVRARDHYFAGLDLAEFHRGLDEFYFSSGKQAAVASLLDHYLQFFGGTNECVAVRRNYAEGADDFFGGVIEKVYGPAESIQEPGEGARDQQGHTFGAGEAEALRDQFAEDDLQNGEQAEGDGQRGAVRDYGGPGARDRLHQRAENSG